MDKKQIYYGFGIKDPIEYAIQTMRYVRDLIGQDKRIDFCEDSLLDYQQQQELIESPFYGKGNTYCEGFKHALAWVKQKAIDAEDAGDFVMWCIDSKW